jgi:hypothetical protein
MEMHSLFQGTPLDVYVHWLILSLGIGILASAGSVLFSCRSVAAVLRLLSHANSWHDRLYRGFFRYHAYYWAVFGFILAFHLMVTTVHVGVPVTGEIVHLAHVIVFVTSITNIVLMLVVLTSCRTVNRLIASWSSRSPLSSSIYSGFYRYHAVYWWLLALSLGGHIVSGMVHSVNT